MSSDRGKRKMTDPYSQSRPYGLRSQLPLAEFIVDRNEQGSDVKKERLSWADRCEEMDVNSSMKVSPCSNGKQRKRSQVPLSNDLDGVKRRLGWNRARNYPDNVSTESSSKHSSDNEGEFDRATSFNHLETDPDVLGRRQKQIDYGRNTRGYHLYLAAIPKEQRTKDHPVTPKKHIKYSRRSWDMQIKIWRRELHKWDVKEEGGDDEEDIDLSAIIKEEEAMIKKEEKD